MNTSPTNSRGNDLHFGKTEAVYTFIRDYLQQEGYPPSIRDIAQGCGLGRTTVIYHLHRLSQWGLIQRAPGRARSIRLIEHEQQAERPALHQAQPGQQPMPILLESLPSLATPPLETE